MPIVWTPEARALLTPRRGEAKAPKSTYDPKTLPSRVRDLMTKTEPKYEAGAEKELGEHELVWEVFSFVQDFDASSPLDARVQGALLAMMPAWGEDVLETHRALVLHWIARGGLAFAVRALYERGRRSTRYAKYAGGTAHDMNIAYLETKGGWSIWQLDARKLRHELALRVLAASDAEYAEVVRAVREAREDATAAIRCDLSSLVPTETAWARKDAADSLAENGDKPEIGSATLLFPALGRCDEARALLAAIAKQPFLVGPCAHDAVFALEEDAMAPLASALAAWEAEPPKANMGLAQAREAARALALFDEERAAKAFSPWIGDAKTFGPIAAEYMQRFPTRAVPLLAPSLLAKTKGAEPAQQLLARVVRAHPDQAREAAKALPADQRAAVEKLAGGASTNGASAAKANELPEVLRDPPWRRRGTRPALPVLAGVLHVPHEERVVWQGEEARASAMKPPYHWAKIADVSELKKEIAKSVARGERDRSFWLSPDVPFHAIQDDARALELWNGTPPWARRIVETSWYSEVAFMLARCGAMAIPGAVASAEASGEPKAYEALARCDSPNVARAMLRALGRGALRAHAVRWLHAFPEAAAIGLLPIALGEPSRNKMDAAAALRAHVDRAVLERVASRMSVEAARAVDAILAFDPLFDCPKSAPKLSAFADPAGLPEVRLADGRALPDDARRNLLEMLQFSPLDPPYAGLARAVATLDRASVDELLRALVDAWVSAGASSANAWALRAIAHVGSPAMARELAAKIRKWPREKGLPRALVGVDVLGAMHTDVALMHLFDLSKTAKNRWVEARAKDVLASAAAARGLDEAALEDRLVPTLDLDPDGTTTLDFGTRKFTVRVDEHLAPHVYEGDARLPSLPRANKNDDADKAKAASARFKTLRSDLETLGKTQLWRFEHAMITGRTWSAGDHRALFVDHPLAGRVTRKLVWAVVRGGAVASTFRVAEDGTFADDRDKPFSLDDDARVGLPHPLALDAPQRARWSELLADYAIIQPFEQIGRATFAVDGKTRDEASIDWFGGRAIPYGVVFGRLESRGWRRGSIDDGSISTLEKSFGPIAATLGFSPSIFMREKPPEDVTIDSVSFGDVKLRDVPAIAYSEALFDLSVFAPK